jgi:hypothetical protein
VWDDEINKLMIVDRKWADPAKVPYIYTFNEIKEDGSSYGELLDINLESSFPPELITQTMLYARYKSAPASERARLIKQWPRIGSTSNFIFSLNWTNLVDLLSEEMQKQPRNSPSALLLTVPGKEGDETVRANVAGGSDPHTATKTQTVSTSKKSKRGAALGTNLVMPKEVPGDKIEWVVRNSVNPKNLKKVATDLMRGDGSNGPNIGAYLTKSTRLLEPRFRAAYEAFVSMVKVNMPPYQVQTNYTVRSVAYQANLIANEKGQKPADPSKSKHVTGQAVDFGLIDNKGNYYSMLKLDPDTNKLHNKLVSIVEVLNSETRSKGLDRAELEFLNDLAERHHIQSKDSRGDTIPDNAFTSDVTYSEYFKLDSQEKRELPTNVPDVLIKNDSTSIESSEEQIKEKNEDIIIRFGNPIIFLVETQPSAMVAKITRDGMNNPNSPNGFILGFPTTTAITVNLLGLAGISISDVFLCDKLPYIFEQYGAFQVLEVTEKITNRGWFTDIRGYFKLIWIEGKP